MIHGATQPQRVVESGKGFWVCPLCDTANIESAIKCRVCSCDPITAMDIGNEVTKLEEIERDAEIRRFYAGAGE